MTDVPMNAPSKPRREGSIFRSRIVRLITGFIVLVAVAAIAVFLIFQQMRASRSQPLDFKVYPGAALLDKSTSTGAESAAYTTPATLQEVVDFYVAEYGIGSERGCILLPSAEQLEVARCIVDNSQDTITQRLLMDIRFDSEQQRTVITVERDWGQ